MVGAFTIDANVDKEDHGNTAEDEIRLADRAVLPTRVVNQRYSGFKTSKPKRHRKRRKHQNSGSSTDSDKKRYVDEDPKTRRRRMHAGEDARNDRRMMEASDTDWNDEDLERDMADLDVDLDEETEADDDRRRLEEIDQEYEFADDTSEQVNRLEIGVADNPGTEVREDDMWEDLSLDEQVDERRRMLDINLDDLIEEEEGLSLDDDIEQDRLDDELEGIEGERLSDEHAYSLTEMASALTSATRDSRRLEEIEDAMGNKIDDEEATDFIDELDTELDAIEDFHLD